jgi:hypothetical protein
MSPAENSTDRSRTSRARSKNRGRALSSTERSRLKRARAKAAQDPVRTFLQTLVDTVLNAPDDKRITTDELRQSRLAQGLLDRLDERRDGAADLSRLWFIFGATADDEKAFIAELNEETFERARAGLTEVEESPESIGIRLATRTLSQVTKAVTEGSATSRDLTAGINACKDLINERTSVKAQSLYAEWTTVKSTLAWFRYLAIPGGTQPTELSDGSFNTPLDPLDFYGMAEA